MLLPCYMMLSILEPFTIFFVLPDCVTVISHFHLKSKRKRKEKKNKIKSSLSYTTLTSLYYKLKYKVIGSFTET